MGKVLLKLGGEKHLGEQRWRGALSVFDKVYCGCFYLENINQSWSISDDNIIIYRINKTAINHAIHGLLWRTKNYKALNWLSEILLALMRVANRDWLEKIRAVEADAALCSYGDYDFSNLISILTNNVVRIPLIKSYKETRPEYNYLEYKSFKLSKMVSLYDVELKKFLDKKYGDDFFQGKSVLIGNDENALPECILSRIQYQKKLSLTDGRTHIVILTFRVDSEPNRERDQKRYYYLDMIKEFLQSGMVVHLHCAKYNNDHNGVNQYEKLVEAYKGQFFLEKPLEMKHTSSVEAWVESCMILSQYDVGVMHNIVDASSVSEFDRINVPHRLFAYEAAHVAPIIKAGENTVLERMFKEKRCGFVYEELADIAKAKELSFEFYVPSYEEYLRKLLEAIEHEV